MIKLIDVLNKNLNKNYKSLDELSKDISSGEVDMKVFAETVFQYINIQEKLNEYVLNNIDDFKVTLSIKEVDQNGKK